MAPAGYLAHRHTSQTGLPLWSTPTGSGCLIVAEPGPDGVLGRPGSGQSGRDLCHVQGLIRTLSGACCCRQTGLTLKSTAAGSWSLMGEGCGTDAGQLWKMPTGSELKLVVIVCREFWLTWLNHKHVSGATTRTQTYLSHRTGSDKMFDSL